MLFIALIFCGEAHATAVYRVKKTHSFVSSTAKFCYEILDLALASTHKSPDDFKLEYVTIDGDEFTRKLMQNEKFTDMIDISFSLARPHWEEQLEVVRVPLLKGYMGYRVSFIREDDIHKFANITTVEQLKSLVLAAGKDWATADIHAKQGFKVLRAETQWVMVKLLMKNRADYVPRGVTEILDEFKRFKRRNKKLAIEPNTLLYIPIPYYFYVNPHKPKLARRLYRGLLNLIEDGTYQKIFVKHFGNFEQKLNLDKRKVFKLENPNITQESLQNVTTFWSQYESTDIKR